jgi:hypothetical protein
MHLLNGIYGQKFNRRYDRVGHVFQGRYKAILVEKESYLLELSRYVVLNPVRAGLVKKAENWKWSSYPATIGLAVRPGFLDSNWILAQFDSTSRSSVDRFKEFVADGLKMERPWKDVRGRAIMCTRDHARRMDPVFRAKATSKGVPRSQILALRPSLEEIFADARTHPGTIWAIKIAKETHHYKPSEIARFLGVHRSKIWKILREKA